MYWTSGMPGRAYEWLAVGLRSLRISSTGSLFRIWYWPLGVSTPALPRLTYVVNSGWPSCTSVSVDACRSTTIQRPDAESAGGVVFGWGAGRRLVWSL